MGVFGDRVSHEDDAERAIRAVIDLHRAVDELSNEIEDQLGRSLTMHSGINTGLVVIGATPTSSRFSDPAIRRPERQPNMRARMDRPSSGEDILSGTLGRPRGGL